MVLVDCVGKQRHSLADFTVKWVLKEIRKPPHEDEEVMVSIT